MAVSIDQNDMAVNPGVVLVSDYVWFKLHGQGSGANTILDEGTGILGEKTITANTPLDWTTDPGWLNVNTASGGNAYMETSPSAEELALFQVYNKTAGSFVFNMEFQCPDVLAGGNAFLSYGDRAKSPPDPGSWSVGVQSANRAVIHFINDAEDAQAVIGTTYTATPGERVVYGYIIDFSNLTMKTFANGVETGSGSIVMPTIDSNSKHLGILGASSSVTLNNEFGESATTTSNDVLIRDIKMFYFPTDISSQHAEIMLQLASYSTELPPILNGM